MWTALLSAFALYPAITGRSTLMIPIAAAAGALGLFTLLAPMVGRRGGARRRRNEPAAAPTDKPEMVVTVPTTDTWMASTEAEADARRSASADVDGAGVRP